MSRHWRGLVCGSALASFAVAFSLTSRATAYCRTTTCDPGSGECAMSEGCVSAGIPLHWPSSCVSFGIQAAGSPLRKVSFDTMNKTVSAAFGRWLKADCGNSDTPTLKVWDYGAVECGKAIYNSDAPNANVWQFRDDEWPYPSGSATLALTIVTFNTKTGEIFDADVEVNSYGVPLTTSSDDVEFDLASIVTHEAGHFLGLSHSILPNATMTPGYNPGETTLRSLDADDEAGVCAIFPASTAAPSDACEPRHGFSTECTAAPEDEGCALRSAPGASPVRTTGQLLLLAAGVLWARRRAAKRRAR